MGASAVVFGVGALLSLATSWILVSRLERIGERLGFTEALLGLVAALAADSPEITSAVTALVHHERAVGAGVVLGSNVFNLAVLLGLAAVVAGRIGLHRRVVVLGGVVAMWVAGVCLAAVAGGIGAGWALALTLVVLVPYAVALGARRSRLRRLPLPERWSRWLATAVTEEELELAEAIRSGRGSWRDALVAGGALVVVVASSVAMERAASSLGRRWAVPGIVVGGLLLAAVTSLPNAVAGVYLAARGRGAAVLSTALNSNTLNVVAGLLLPATITGLQHPAGPGTLVAAWYVGLTAVTLVLAWRGRGLGRWSGWIVMAGYGGFVGALLAVTG